ncbi:hypothetical protein AO924_35280 [Pseudomonas aeruginosa]|nr:hypothetical protein AO924_35280 [Pseudomonas aeruginosa]
MQRVAEPGCFKLVLGWPLRPLRLCLFRLLCLPWRFELLESPFESLPCFFYHAIRHFDFWNIKAKQVFTLLADFPKCGAALNPVEKP